MSTKLCFYLVYLLSQKKIRITVQTQQLHRWANERKQVCLMKRYFRESVIIMQMLHFPDSFVWRETALLPLSMLSKFSWCVGPLGLRSVFPLSSILLWGTDNKSDPLPGSLKKTRLQFMHSTRQSRHICEKMITLQSSQCLSNHRDGQDKPGNIQSKNKKKQG